MLNEDSISLDPLNLGEMNALISLWHLSRGPLESSYHCINLELTKTLPLMSSPALQE